MLMQDKKYESPFAELNRLRKTERIQNAIVTSGVTHATAKLLDKMI